MVLIDAGRLIRSAMRSALHAWRPKEWPNVHMTRERDSIALFIDVSRRGLSPQTGWLLIRVLEGALQKAPRIGVSVARPEALLLEPHQTLEVTTLYAGHGKISTMRPSGLDGSEAQLSIHDRGLIVTWNKPRHGPFRIHYALPFKLDVRDLDVDFGPKSMTIRVDRKLECTPLA